MSLSNHLTELERKHQILDKEVDRALAQPSTPDEQVAELKRRKLALKDGIERIKQKAA